LGATEWEVYGAVKEMAKEAAAAKLQEWYRAVKGVATETMAVKEAVSESATANGVVNPTMVACEQELDKVAVTVTSAAKRVMNQTVVAHEQDPDKVAETMERPVKDTVKKADAGRQRECPQMMMPQMACLTTVLLSVI